MVETDDGGLSELRSCSPPIRTADGPTSPALVQGSAILLGSVQLSENIVMGGSPDLLTTAAALPMTPLDLSTPGIVTLEVSLGFESFGSIVFSSFDFDAIDPAQDPEFSPEPEATLASLAAILTIGVLRARRRTGRGVAFESNR